jgi:hypothetical protein
MKILSLKLPESLDEALEAAAARQGTTKSALLREALASYLEHTGQVSEVREPASPYGEEQPPRASFLALAGDLAGCVEGPPDLSTNPEHLRGFGQ